MTRRFILTILGQEGAGKTHLTREIMYAAPQPIFVIDTQAQFGDGLQFDSAPQLASYITARRPNRSNIYVLNATSDEDSKLFFRLLDVLRTPSTAIVDEGSLFCSPNYIDEHFNNLIQYGRHWKQNIIVNARRPAEVSRHVTGQSAAVISFRQTEPRDVQYMQKSFSDAEHLPDLDDHEFMAFGNLDRLPFRDVLENMKTARGTAAFANHLVD